MTGKIKFIEPRGEYTNASGTFNKYQVTFDDGKSFQMLARGEFKKQIGDKVDYTITNEEYKTAKLVYPLPPQNNNREQLIVRQSMVKAACEFHAHRPQSDIHTVLVDSQLLIEFINK
tara:strand:- start:1650 stop:2000 length:351 start_codon:yes stop_codon:yes gene_type:complete